MAFERFEIPGERLSKKISVWKQGVIHVSKGTMNSFSLKGLGFCTLHYDRGTKKVGIQFIGSPDIHGTVKLSFRDVGAVIPAKSFFDYYQISYNPSRQYVLEQDVESGLLVFDLGAPVDDNYVEHPDGRYAEQACSVLIQFLTNLGMEIPFDQAASVGRFLFESGVYLNWEQKDMMLALENILSRAKGITSTEKFSIPLEKVVFDIFQRHYKKPESQ